MPARFGKWYAKAGFQYYNILNDNLLLAQTIVGTAATFATAHEDVCRRLRRHRLQLLSAPRGGGCPVLVR